MRFLIVQVVAWLAGLALAIAGLFGELAGYGFEVASFEVTLIFVALLIFAPVFWFSGRNSLWRFAGLWRWVFQRGDVICRLLSTECYAERAEN